MPVIIFANDLPYRAGDGREDPLTAIGDTLAFAANDWGESRATSWIYGIVLGWGDAMDEQAARHGWSPEQVAKLRGLHEAWEALEAARKSGDA